MKNPEPQTDLDLRFLLPILCVVALPLVLQGFGSDWDAWGVAQAAEKMWQSHSYHPSRLPGFPLYELLVTPIVVQLGWVGSNLVSLVSLVGILYVMRALARSGHFRYPHLTTIALVFLPIVLRDATSTMDYLPGLFLLMLAYLDLVRGRPFRAAIWIGLAAGVRFTLAGYLIPAMVYVALEGRNIRTLAGMAGTALAIALVSFSPALLSPGFAFVTIPAMGAKTWLLYAGYNLMDLFGLPGWLVLFGLGGRILYSGSYRKLKLADPLVAFHLLVILLWLLLFLMMPHEPDYLLPALPSFFFLIDRTASRRSLLIVVVVLMSNHFVTLSPLAGESGQRKLAMSVAPGMTLGDALERRHALSYRKACNEGQPDQPTLLMYGWYYAVVDSDGWELVDEEWNIYRREDGQLMLADRILDLDLLKELKQEGWRVVVWRHRKGEFVTHGPAGWEEVVEVEDDLESVLSIPVAGMPRR